MKSKLEQMEERSAIIHNVGRVEVSGRAQGFSLVTVRIALLYPYSMIPTSI